MSSDEGWDGKGVRDHVEEAKAMAAECLDVSREAASQLAALTDRLAEIEAADPGVCDPAEAGARPGSDACLCVPDPSLKAMRVRFEIGVWQNFIAEASAVRKLIEEWKALPVHPFRGEDG